MKIGTDPFVKNGRLSIASRSVLGLLGACPNVEAWSAMVILVTESICSPASSRLSSDSCKRRSESLIAPVTTSSMAENLCARMGMSLCMITRSHVFCRYSLSL